MYLHYCATDLIYIIFTCQRVKIPEVILTQPYDVFQPCGAGTHALTDRHQNKLFQQNLSGWMLHLQPQQVDV